MGKLEFFPRTTSPKEAAAVSTDKETAAAPTNEEAVATSTIKEATTASTQDHHFIMAANNIVITSKDFLGDTSASHHIAHRFDCFCV